jgi:hypothetical protein
LRGVEAVAVDVREAEAGWKKFLLQILVSYINFMLKAMLTAIPTLADHLTCLIQALCAIVLREGRRLHMPRPLIVLASNRVARLANRFIALVERFCAGALPPPGGERRRPAGRG